MSQRGMRLKGALSLVRTFMCGKLRTIVGLTLALTLGTALAVLAQDLPAHLTKKAVTIRVDGTVREVSTTKEHVKDLLQQESITLGQHDRITPAIDASVTDGLTISINRVTCEIVKEKYAIDPPTITRWDRRMTVKPVVLRQGKPGVGVRTRVMWKMDGVISEQWTQNPKVVTKPTPSIVVRGNQPSRGLAGRKTLRMVSTAYDPGPLSCGKYASGYTAIGMKATRGVVAVDPRVIPLGTRVYVEGYGPAIAADTGGAIKGHKIDVCFPTRREALQWGRRTVTVIVLE